MLQLWVFCVFIYTIYAETFISHASNAPYPAGGWRPQISFNLPGEYLPPETSDARQQQLKVSIDLTKERVDFVGQFGNQFIPGDEPQNVYLPAIKVPQQQPNRQIFGNNNQQSFGYDAVPQPAQHYGTPYTNLKHPEPRTLAEADDKLDPIVPIAALNPTQADSQTQAFEVAKEKYSNVNEGRYYILTPESQLQRVVYKTGQDPQDVSTNGFTALLKYTTLGDITDPIYKYNNRGQLVRVARK